MVAVSHPLADHTRRDDRKLPALKHANMTFHGPPKAPALAGETFPALPQAAEMSRIRLDRPCR